MKNVERKQALAKVAKVIGELENSVVYPANLMKPLCTAMVQATTKPVTSNVSDIELYSVFSKDTNEFLGSFSGMEYQGRYYGNMIGSIELICLEKDVCNVVKTTTPLMYFPIEDDYLLKCTFRGGMNLCADELIEVDSFKPVHVFDGDVSFFVARVMCREMIFSS